MDTDLQIILEFLARCGAEVEGRGQAAPEAEDATLLFRFAVGQCDSDERAIACELIHRHPDWLGWVAHRAKARRVDPPPSRSHDNGSANWNS